jgi:hypothetical protein
MNTFKPFESSITVDQAREIIEANVLESGVKMQYNNSSTTNGISLYYTAEYNGVEQKVRFSNHGISNFARMATELSYDISSKLDLSRLFFVLGVKGYVNTYHQDSKGRWVYGITKSEVSNVEAARAILLAQGKSATANQIEKMIKSGI